MRQAALHAVGGILLTIGVSAAAPAGGPRLVALSQLEPGAWQLRENGETGDGRTICVADPRVLLQLGHPGARCSRVVIADTPEGVTVHYTCPGAGHGRTVIGIETPRLIHLETQGIAGGAPFDHDYEGRHIGACTPPTR